MPEIAAGDRVIGFNAREWEEAGFDQPDGNGQFLQEAIVERVYYRAPSEYGSGGWLADLRWPDGRSSSGHFVHGLDALPLERTRGSDA